jgi:hypothetical protein
MKIEDMHLKEGEIEDLFDFLRSNDDWGEKRIRNGSEKWFRDFAAGVLADLDQKMSEPRHRARRDQFMAKMRDYQSVSTFGKNKEEIFRNSRIHLLACEKCFIEYKSKVEKIAGEYVRAIEEVKNEPRSASATESPFYEEQLFLHDILKILDHPGIYGMGIT